jgi:hypothetical protein
MLSFLKETDSHVCLEYGISSGNKHHLNSKTTIGDTPQLFRPRFLAGEKTLDAGEFVRYYLK